MKIGKIEPNSTKAKDTNNDGRRVKLSFKERNIEMAKQVVNEIVSQIPRDETFKNNSELWNCGYDCIHFVPAEEREKETELDLCKKKKGVVSFKKKRCPLKEVHNLLKIVPSVIEDLDEDKLKTIPEKPKR